MYNVVELKEKLSAILQNAGDAGQISEILTDVTSNYNEVLKTVEEIRAENEKLSANNASLVKANGELFMRVGMPAEQVKEAETQAEESPSLEEVLEDILDEKGRLIK